MKKVFAAIAASIFVISTATITVSAEEYEIQKGDNLWDIANDNQTSVEELMNINDLKDTVIHPKQIILLNERYTVEHGDTLEGISEKYNVTIDEIKNWNNLKTDIIVIGQELEIKSINNELVSDSKEKTKSVESAEDNEVTSTEASATQSDNTPEGKTLTVSATAYTASCEGCSGITYTGLDLNKNPNAKVIAVDPNVIPLGSEVYVEGYGYATAADIGSAIKGNKIDVFVPTLSGAQNWGTRSLKVTIIK